MLENLELETFGKAVWVFKPVEREDSLKFMNTIAFSVHATG